MKRAPEDPLPAGKTLVSYDAGELCRGRLALKSGLVDLADSATLRAVLATTAATIPVDGVHQSDWQGEQLTVVRATHTGTSGFDLLVSKEQAEPLWMAFIAAGKCRKSRQNESITIRNG